MLRKHHRILLLASSSALICALAYYINSTVDIDAVYTSLFYIPVIMAGLWYYRSVIPLAVAFAAYYNLLEVLQQPGMSNIDQIFHGAILILGAIILYYFGRRFNEKNRALTDSNNLLGIEKERLRVMLQSIGDGVISADEQGNVTFLNPVAQSLTGWAGDGAVGRPFEEVFNIVSELTGEPCENPVQKVLESGEVIGLANHTVLIARDGTQRPIADSAAPIRDGSGKIHGAILVFRDVADERQKREEIEYLSYHDTLTGLHNRRYFEKQLALFDNVQHLPLAVIMGDVNGLKLTNDAFGHAMGDNLLKKAAEALKAVCRSKDVVCRYGGDEFIVLLPGTGEAEAEQIAKRFKDSFSSVKIGPVGFSMSLGWAVKEKPEEDAAQAIKTAEDLMYKHKLFESPRTRRNIIHGIMGAMNGAGEGERSQTERVAAFYWAIASAYGMSDEEAAKYKAACMFYDIGKIAVEQGLLNKREPLLPEEWEAVKRHAEAGYRILSAIPEFAEIADLALYHHERWDGTGYPRGLKGGEIPFLARILAVVDAFGAMTSDRPYRKARAEVAAADEIMRCAGTQFDPEVARTFVEKILGREWGLE